MTEEPDFKGYIHDVGGPTANFRCPACEKQLTKGACPNRQCLFPEPCKNLRADHSDYIVPVTEAAGDSEGEESISSVPVSVLIICWRIKTGHF